MTDQTLDGDTWPTHRAKVQHRKAQKARATALARKTSTQEKNK
jgi:hypothetical protein